MKTFHYERGHEAGETMTVAELCEKLNEYPQEMPVFCEWEGVHSYVGPHDFAIESVHKGDVSEKCDCLVIDVNGY